ncbi:MAG: transporter [Flavobacterium sp.]|nr:transporter [Flavobacterium sp.]
MFNKKIIFILVFFMSTATIFAQYTDVINSNRPGESMSAFSVGKTLFQTEVGLSKINEEHNTLNYGASGYALDFALRYGMFASEFELITNLQYQKDTYTFGNTVIDRSGNKKFSIGGKYLFYDPYKKEVKPNLYSWKANHSFHWKSLIPAISAYVGLNLNFSNNAFSTVVQPPFSPKIMLITQNQFSGSQVFVMNFYMDNASSDNSTLGYVLTYTKGFNDHWSAFIENKGFKSNFYSDGIVTGGVAYLFDKSKQVDVSISKSFKNTPSLIYGGVGFSWRFDGNYKPDKVKVSKNKKSKSDNKKDKAKEAEKKRIDDAGEKK